MVSVSLATSPKTVALKQRADKNGLGGSFLPEKVFDFIVAINAGLSRHVLQPCQIGLQGCENERRYEHSGGGVVQKKGEREGEMVRGH